MGNGLSIAGLLVFAAACSPTVETAGPAAPPLVQPVSGDRIGSGSVKIALLIPSSATGNAALVAASLRNAAELALRDTPGADLQILVKDDHGTTEGGRAAAVEAIDAGAELIIGPLFAASVSGAAPVAKGARVPMIAFSSDANVASRGVYLLSFLPEGDATRITSFAAARGKRSLAALLPESGYGTVFGAALQRAAAAAGSQIVAVEHYGSDAASLAQRTATIAALASGGQVSALAVPDGGDAPLRVGDALAAAGLAPGRVQLLGSGQWDDPRILATPSLAGAWFPAPDRSGFGPFSARYSAAFGSAPPRPAALAYDATRLAAGLAVRYGAKRFAVETLTNPNGFTGVDGAFRLLPDGLNERALAIYEIAPGGPRLIDPAPTRFARPAM